MLATASSISSSSTLSSLIVLPIQHINLSVTGKEKNVKINWKIEADEHLQSVEIEKSRDGSNFTVISKTLPQQVSASQYIGSYEDSVLTAGQLFYRLKLEKMDGSFSYSSIKVFNQRASAILSISPNPAVNYFVVNIPSSFVNRKQPMGLMIYDVSGTLVKKGKIDANTNVASVSCASFKPGIYRVVVGTDTQRLQTQFLKQ